MTIIARALVGFVLCLVVAGFVPVQVRAQEGQGTLSGTIKDAEGAAVSGAEVSLAHNHGVLRTNLSDANGSFALNNLAPGTYELSVKRLGFEDYRSAVQVIDGDTKNLTVVLQVNPFSEQVTVTAEAGQVSEARSVSQPVNVITEKEILNRTT